MVAVVIDFSEKVEKFLNQPVTFKEIIVDYYLNFIPWINGLLWPLFALIAVIFFTSRLAKDSEIISILASGVSYYRIMVPYLLASSFLALLLWVGNNYVIPKSTEIKATFENTYIWRGNKKTLNANVHMRTGPNEKIFVRNFRSSDSTMIDFRLETFNGGEMTRFLKAKRLKYNNSNGKWTMKDYMVRTFDGLNESMIIESGKELDTLLNFTPEEFIRFSNQMDMMTSPEIKRYVLDQTSRGITNPKKFMVEYHRRNADPFTIIILTIIGMSLASRKVRGGLGLNLALGLLLGSLFVLISKFSTTFAFNQTLTPLLGIWIPNFVFAIIAIILLMRAQK
jgi:lipopolysaccharide export system permease protein